jgi:hypothetical protein
MFIKKVAKKLLSILNTLKIFLKLDRLNIVEKSGQLLFITKFKFFFHTKIIVPFSLGQSIRGLSFRKYLENDPFAVFVKKIFENKNKETIQRELFKDLEKEKTLTAADIIGLENNLKLAKFPSWALVLPWEKISIEKKFENYESHFIKNRLKYSSYINNFEKSFDNKFVYSNDYVQTQFYQTQNLLKNIKKNGLKPYKFNDSPKISILINNQKWKWVMSGEGNHRAYISNLCGHEFFECTIEMVVNKKDIKSFYNVKNGLYSISEAAFVFDNFFTGKKCLRGII